MKLPRAWALVALAATAVFWTALVAVPLVSVLMRAGGGHTLLDEGVLQAARMTLWQAGWSTLLSAGGGLALGLWLGSVREGRATKAAELFLAIPFGTPTLVVALSWVGILGRSNLNYSLHAVILAHVFLNIPLVALAVGFARREVPLPALEAVKTLGAGALTRFRFVIWPVIRGAFASSAAQVAALCSMSFALVLILGGGPPVETLETALYSRVRYGTLDLEAAAACAVWQIAITLLPWTLVLLLPAPIAGERASGRRGSSAGGGGLGQHFQTLQQETQCGERFGVADHGDTFEQIAG
ncbi:MAG: ABC transporter permease subunit [Bdellovibrionota bacterium]